MEGVPKLAMERLSCKIIQKDVSKTLQLMSGGIARNYFFILSCIVCRRGGEEPVS